MASFDYAPIAATANTLLAKFGRTITLEAYNATLEESAKPWKGPLDARTVPSVTETRNAAQVEPSSLQKLGLSSRFEDLVARADRVYIVAAGSTALSVFSTVVDGGVSYNIEGFETLRPGATEVLNYLAVSR